MSFRMAVEKGVVLHKKERRHVKLLVVSDKHILMHHIFVPLFLSLCGTDHGPRDCVRTNKQNASGASLLKRVLTQG